MYIHRPILITLTTFFLQLIPWYIILEVIPYLLHLQLSIKDIIDPGLLFFILKGQFMSLIEPQRYLLFIIACVINTILSLLAWKFKLFRTFIVVLGIITVLFSVTSSLLFIVFTKCEGLGCMGVGFFYFLSQVVLLFIFTLMPVVVIQSKNLVFTFSNIARVLLLTTIIYYLLSVGSFVLIR